MGMERIPVGDLRPGMYVLNTGISWLNAPLLYMREGLVANQAEVDDIIQQGFTEVIHDPERSFCAHAHGDFFSAEFSRQLEEAQKTHANAYAHVKAAMTCGKCGSAEIAGAVPCVRAILLALKSNANAMLTLANLKRSDEYTYRHCVHVAIFAVAFARFLGLAEHQQQLAGIAGLFHDYGKALVPKEILNAPRTLSPTEFTVMRSHVQLGYEALRQIPDVPPEILEGALQHHEMHNGTGYPNKLRGSAIGTFGRIVSVCDVYDALSSRRVYKSAISPSHALGIMYKMNGTAWPPDFIDSFIRMMGLFPMGTAVELSDGRTGLVSRYDPDHPTRPGVIIIKKSKGSVHMDYCLDLKTQDNIFVNRALTCEEAEGWNIPHLLGITEQTEKGRGAKPYSG